MKTLLILSKNTSHIALIDNSSNESLLDALNAYINDNEENALMSYMLEQMGEKAFFTESSQKPSFIDLIEENDIQFILTYFKDIKRVSFNIKSNDIFFSFDLKDYVNQYSFENFCNLIKEQENARTSFGFTNEEDNEENRRGERQEIQRGTQGRGENRLFGESNAEDRNADEPRGVGEERGISKSSTGIRRFDRVAGETEGYDRGDEQRRGLGEEKLSRPIYSQTSKENDSADTQKESKEIFDRRSIQTKNISGDDRLSPQEQIKISRNDEFRTRIESLLQRSRIRTTADRLLFLRNRRDSIRFRERELSNSKISNRNTDLQDTIYQGRLQSSGESHRGIEESRYRRDDRDEKHQRRDVERPAERARTVHKGLGRFEQSGSGANATSTDNQQEHNSGERADATILSGGGKELNLFSFGTEQEESNIANDKQELMGDENRENSTGNKQYGELEIGRQSENLYDSNGVLQEQSRGQNQENELYREVNSTRDVGEDNTLQQDLLQTQEYSLENTEILRRERTQTYEHIEYGRALDETLQIEKKDSMADRDEIRPFRIFNKYEFIKKLDGEEYKGEIDFKLSKKQRIEANFNALYLVKTIFERKENANRVDLIEIEKEYKELNYFSLDCPYSKAEQEVLARYSGFGGLKDLFYDESYKDQREKLLELVGQEFYDEMKFSSYNAYYTPNAIIEAMYSGLNQLGVPSNEIVSALEPSCGIGHFITKAPPNYQFTAIEKDSLSATIAKLLHPQTTIYNESYENVMFSREFDVVIGNPPYENERAENSKELIHNYFVLKSQDLLKNGGLSSFVITAGFMDSKNNFHREQLMENSVMLSAFRLPNSSFKNTHTEVLSDIVFLGKTNDKAKFLKDNKSQFPHTFSQLNVNEELFLPSVEKTIDDEKTLKINGYFDYYTDNILGSSEIAINQFGEYALKVKEYEDKTLTSLIEEKIQDRLQNPDFPNSNFIFYDKTPAFKADEISISELNLSPSELRYIDNLKIGNVFEFNDTFTQLQRVEESISLQSFKQEDKLEDKIAILTHNQSNIANAKRVRDLL